MSNAGKFEIFRHADAYRVGMEGVLTTDPTPVQAAGLDRMIEAGVMDGAEFTVLSTLPGFSLVHAWVKKDYPLPLHSHNGDGLYHIIAGTLRMGTEELVAGDSIFIPADTPYTYRAGPDGAEVLEFRHDLGIDFRNYAKNQAFYDKAVATILENRDGWRTAAKPARATA